MLGGRGRGVPTAQSPCFGVRADDVGRAAINGRRAVFVVPALTTESGPNDEVMVIRAMALPSDPR